MLIGQYDSKLTDKNRIAVPKKFRQELGVSLIVARWYEGCLVLVSEGMWKKIYDKLSGATKFITKSVRDTDRFILGSAYEITADSQGRVVLNENLISYAGLEGEIVFLGLIDRVEIWSKKAWEEKEKYVAENAAEFIEELAKKDE